MNLLKTLDTMKLLSMKDLQSALDLDCFQVKDRENATLRNELTKLKAQLNHEQRGKEILEARESERKIALEAKERERKRMAEQVEEKRRARKQKQREQAQVPIICHVNQAFFSALCRLSIDFGYAGNRVFWLEFLDKSLSF